MALEIQQTMHGENLVLTCTGTMGVEDAKELEQALMLASPSRPKLTVFDMSGVTFISSLALGSILSYRRGLTRHDCEVVLAGVTEMVLDVIKRAQLDTVLKQYDSVDAALATEPAS